MLRLMPRLPQQQHGALKQPYWGQPFETVLRFRSTLSIQAQQQACVQALGHRLRSAVL